MKESDKQLWDAYINNELPVLLDKVQIDKRKKTQNISNVLDLHNYTVQDAFNMFNEFMEIHAKLLTKKVLVITGKSGQIYTEFSVWAANNKHVRAVEPKNNGGAYSIKLLTK